MPMFRLKPVVVEARQFKGELESGPAGCGYIAADREVLRWCHALGYHVGQPYISTPSGPLYIFKGDWIVRSTVGMFVPTRSDIFEAHYDLVEDGK